MARRADPEHIFHARRIAIRIRLTSAGMDEATADGSLDGWILEATGGGLSRDGGDYWQDGLAWIAEERAARRPGW